MKNLYLNFCKLATLVLMVGLTANYLAIKNWDVSLKVAQVFAAAAQIGGQENGYQCAGNEANRWKIESGNEATLPNDKSFASVIVKASTDCIPVSPANESDGCYSVNIVGKTVTVTKLGDGPDCQDISHLEGTYSVDPSPTPTPDPEDPSSPSMSSVVSCGEIEMTFNNPTPWFFSFDYRKDSEAGHDDAVTGMNIANGSWAGQPFGQRYNEVDVLAGQTANQTVTFAEDTGVHTVAYRLWRGAENDMYLDWVTKEIQSDCDENTCQETVTCPDVCRSQREVLTGICGDVICGANAETCSDPTPTPTLTPTPSPEVPGYNCPVAQSCSNACGQPARDIPNGSCGYIHCDPTPACGETPVGGVVLGATTAKPAGQVLGATTEYAATGVAEDFAFSLIGFAGTGLSGLGILMKRHAKASN